MDKQAAFVGSLLTLLFLVVIGVVTIGTGPGRVGGTPRSNKLTRWPDEERGRGTTPYSGGKYGLGVGVELGVNASPELDDFFDPGLPGHAMMPHRCRYPRSSGEVLETLMQGHGMVKPPIPWNERVWLYAPPAKRM